MTKTIKDIGERGLLELFEPLVDKGDLPFNDDAVAFSTSADMSMVVNIDTFVAKTDAPPEMSPFQMGAKTVTMAISDLAAKGAQPQFVVASGAFPENFSVEQTLELVKGIRETAHKYNAKYLGGDTNAADDIVISVVALGEIQKSKLMKRTGAESGEIICTTGDFGLTGAGFKIFLENFTASKEQTALFRKAVFDPQARVKEGLTLANTGYVTSCIDSSDGLAWCLKEILRGKGNLGIEIDYLPIPKEVYSFAIKHNLVAEDLALYSGEEFELVFTLKEKWFKEIQKQTNCIKIGKITSENPGKILLKTDSIQEEIIPKGWEHFKKQD